MAQRGRTPAPPPPYELLTSEKYRTFVQHYENLDGDKRALQADISQLKKDWRENGLDPQSHEFIMRWKRKIESGKAVVQDLFGQIERIRFYADTVFGDQADLFRESAEHKPPPPEAAVEGQKDAAPATAVNKATAGTNGKAKNGAGKGAGKKGAGVTKGDAKGAIEAADKPQRLSDDDALQRAKEHLGTAEPASAA